jgi:hypothetical protein
MTWFSRPSKSRQSREPESPPPDALAELRGAVAQYERAREIRDSAIVAAARQETQRAAAEVSGLSLSRVKQITAGGLAQATRLPITDVDILQGDPADRVLSVFDVDPFLERAAESERDFIAADPRRATGNRYDLSTRLYDTDPSQAWVAVYIDTTQELYVFPATATGNWHTSKPESSEPADMTRGSTSGPVYVLGHLPFYKLVDDGVNFAASKARDRPGGLAWLYGRIQLLNRVTRAFTTSSQLSKEDLWDYLAALPDNERPNF